jgi:DNA-binding NtrC family response regulator
MNLDMTQDRPIRTLLLVDDDTAILSSLKRLLRREGYDILAAEDGLSGMEKMAVYKVNVVVCDGLMRGMTGSEFLRLARSRYPDTIRIMLSGYTDPAVTLDAMANCDLFRFLTKPWDDTELITTIRDAFRHHESRHQCV